MAKLPLAILGFFALLPAKSQTTTLNSVKSVSCASYANCVSRETHETHEIHETRVSNASQANCRYRQIAQEPNSVALVAA